MGTHVQVQCLEDLISSLLDCSTSYSTCEAITKEVSDSLSTIGEHQPNTVLTSCHHYLLQNPRLQPSNKAFVFSTVHSLAANSEVVAKLDEQLVLLIINLATQDMTMTTKDSDAEWAQSAHRVLVAFGSSARFVSHVMDAVLQKFPPGLTVSPHKYIVLTMATLAQQNPLGLIPFLIDILSRTVPLLPHVRTDTLKCAWARAICSFCEAIRECQTERPKEAVEHVEENGSPQHTLPSSDLSSRIIYSDQAEAIYDVIFPWMSSKDPKTRSEAGECIGELCLIIRPSKVVDDLKKLVTTLIGLYRKAYTEQHTITMAMCRFLESTCMDDLCPLDPYVEDILGALFPNACLDPDDASASLNSNAIKNHSEAFRCFHVAAARFADKIVYYLLHKMQNVADIQKLAAINILRHLLNSSGKYMEDKRSLVMMGLRKLLAAEQTTSIRVKRSIVQLCVALADHAYVDSEGGDYVIAFLVRNLVPPSDNDVQTRRIELDVAGSNQLRTQCAQALHTIASTCVCASKLLWPYLLEVLCVDRFNPVVGDLCKSLRTLVSREKEAGRDIDYVTGFDNVRVAGRHAVLARLFVGLCNAPLNGLLARRARESMLFLNAVAAWFDPSLVDIIEKWTTRMEPLLDELSNASLSSPPNTTRSTPLIELRGRRVARWHDSCVDMLSACISHVIDGDWRQDLAAAMAKQLDLYKEAPEEKAFLLRCLGTTLAKITLQSFVVEHLMLMFKTTHHSNATERLGCARGVGACAAVHTDTVLIELENVSKWEHAKKSSGIFGFIKDAMPMRAYSDVDMINLRATIMLSYGHVIMACSLDTVVQRLRNTIILFLRHYFADNKQETVVREAMLETMRLIAVAVQPSRLGAEYRLEVRNELLGYIKDYIKSESPELLASSLRLLAAKAAAALVRLEPALNDADLKDLSQVLTQNILPMCREKSGLKTLTYDLFDQAPPLSPPPFDDVIEYGYRKIDDDESATVMDATVCQYGTALEALVVTKPTLNTVTIVLKMLQQFYGRSADHERCRAIDATVLVLRVYFETAEDIVLGHASDFSPLSSLLARLAPRLSDSLAQVRYQALCAIHWAMRLSHVHKGHGRDTDPGLFSVTSFSQDYLSGEGKLEMQLAKKAVREMAEVIDSRLPSSQMQLYLSGLLEMVTDRQSQVSAAAAQLLTYFLTQRGANLVAEGPLLVSSMLDHLPSVHSCVHTYSDLLSAVVAFANHQTHVVCDVLLKQSLPISIHPCDAWESLSRERNLFSTIIDYLLELLTASLDSPYDVMDTGGNNVVKIVHVEPCQYAAAITEVVKNGDSEWCLNERVPALLAVLMSHVCSVSDTQFPVLQKESKDGSKHPLIITPELRRGVEKPANLAVAAIRGVLNRLHATNIVEDMNQARGWSECIDKDLFIGALSQLVRSIAVHRPDWAVPLWTSVKERADSESEPIRLNSVIVAAALIRNCPDSTGKFNEKLLIECVRLLQNELTDQSLRIRMLCIRGLGELADCPSSDVTARFTNMAVEAAMGGLDDLGDRKDTVAMESMFSLSKLVSRTDDQQLKAILPQVLLKIRPCFEKESASLRAASFSLFGELGHRVGGASDDYVTHLHTNIITILLHMNDENEDVKKKSSQCLYRLHSLLALPLASNLIESEMPNGTVPSSYDTFIKDLAAILALSFPDRVNQYALTCSNYYKSSSALIRCNSASLTGHLLCALTPQLRATISKDLVFSGLVLLLKDQDDVTVRIAATRAIASLHAFS